MRCTKCNKKIPDGSEYCPECGKKLTELANVNKSYLKYFLITGGLIIVIVGLLLIKSMIAPACNTPYIKVGSDCCLDVNGNGICDKDEQVKEGIVETPQKVVCNRPYMHVGNSCCLDQDNNGICDKDEIKDMPQMQTQTEETSKWQGVCATDVLFKIKSVCVPVGSDGFHYRITISNDGNIDIDRFVISYYASPDNVTQKEVLFNQSLSDYGIEKFGIEFDQQVDSEQSAVKMIEAIPVVEIGGKTITCTQNIDAYGDASEFGAVIGSCG